MSKDAPYFHASYRQAFPCKPGNFVVADIKGQGHYVGTVLSVRSTEPGWFGEGDEFFYLDGEKVPSLRGTGLEDYFGQAWGLRKSDGPYQGCSLWEGGFTGSRCTAYRWHMKDPVRFEKDLRVEIEHKGVGVGKDGKGGNNFERSDEYSSVAFWYQTGAHMSYPPLPKGMDRLPFDYRDFQEFESLKALFSAGKTEIVTVPGLHGGKQLEWSEAKRGARLDFPFRVGRDGVYQLMVLGTHRWDGGEGQFLIDGEPLGDVHSFRNGEYLMHREMALPLGKLKSGDHTLSLRTVKAGWFGLDGFIVQPLRTAEPK